MQTSLFQRNLRRMPIFVYHHLQIRFREFSHTTVLCSRLCAKSLLYFAIRRVATLDLMQFVLHDTALDSPSRHSVFEDGIFLACQHFQLVICRLAM